MLAERLVASLGSCYEQEELFQMLEMAAAPHMPRYKEISHPTRYAIVNPAPVPCCSERTIKADSKPRYYNLYGTLLNSEASCRAGKAAFVAMVCRLRYVGGWPAA